MSVSSTLNSSSTATFYRGAVVVADALRAIRIRSIDLLKRQFTLAENDGASRSVLHAPRAATSYPIGAAYSYAFVLLMTDDIGPVGFSDRDGAYAKFRVTAVGRRVGSSTYE